MRRTERLLIDRLTSADAPAVAANRDDPAVSAFQGWSLPYTVEQAEQLIRLCAHGPGPVQLAIRLHEGTLIGDLMVRPTSVEHVVELGITIGTPWQRRGFASEAVRGITDALFVEPDLLDMSAVLKLAAIVATNNTASLRVFDGLRFRREGVTRQSYRRASGEIVDEVVFGLTRGDWCRDEIPFDLLAFDADDTLWKSEDSFVDAEQTFVELVSPYVSDGIDVKAALTAVERTNLHIFGYGVKSFGLSMVQCATTLAEDIPASVVGRLIGMTRSMLHGPVHLLPDAAAVLEQLGDAYRLILITKGDLIHQTAKVEASGLAHHFEQIEIVMEKDAATYAAILARTGVQARRFCMIGNSVKSDVLPVLALGGSAVHVPYPLLWDLEQAPLDHGSTFAELASLAELPAWLDAAGAAVRASTTARGG